MQFDVMFSIEAETPEAAAEEVSGWRVTPGATLKWIMSSQPVVVMNHPQEVPESGEVGTIEPAAPEPPMTMASAPPPPAPPVEQ